MALIACSECDKQISDKAAACPQCGAPIAATTRPIPAAATTAGPLLHSSPVVKKKTHPLTWLVLIALVVGAFWYIPKLQREASLPDMPVKVQFRNSLTGPGLVLMVNNTSDRHLTFMVSVSNPTTKQEKRFRLDAPPNGTAEVGYKEGWVLASGDSLAIENHDYQTWNGNIP